MTRARDGRASGRTDGVRERRVMTHGFEQQDTLANLVFTKAAAQPHQVGVKLPQPAKPAKPQTAAKRLPVPSAF